MLQSEIVRLEHADLDRDELSLDWFGWAWLSKVEQG